jgi:hypothetical protein
MLTVLCVAASPTAALLSPSVEMLVKTNCDSGSAHVKRADKPNGQCLPDPDD